MPDSTVARSAFAHDEALSEVAESLFAHPDKVNAAATARTVRIPKFFFTVAPKG
jgi:hypothetical protein